MLYRCSGSSGAAQYGSEQCARDPTGICLELALPQGRWAILFDSTLCTPPAPWTNAWLALDDQSGRPITTDRDDAVAMCVDLVELDADIRGPGGCPWTDSDLAVRRQERPSSVVKLAGNFLCTALSLAFEDTLRLFDSRALRGRVMDVQESQPAQTPHDELMTKTH